VGSASPYDKMLLLDLGAALLERRMASQTSIAVCLEVVEQQA